MLRYHYADMDRNLERAVLYGFGKRPSWGNTTGTAAALLASFFLGLGAACSQDSPPAGDLTPERLAALPTDGWPTNGGNLFNQRYSPLTRINRDNVAELRGVWRARLGGSGVGQKYSGEAQPIVYEGVAYIVTGADDVFAISVETGETLWTYEANLNQSIDVICCGWTSRGVGLSDDKIFVGQLDAHLVALDRMTGEVVWDTQTENWEDGYSLTSAPLYYDGLVITGFAGAERGIRGRVKAYNADDGSLAWTFYTVPGPGEFGSETWPQPGDPYSDVYLYGGGSVWQTPAVDPELGLVYFSTGNPGPDFAGYVRAGDNLFTTSMLALDVYTGEYRWHFQQVHHDIWDYDAANPVVLFDIEIDGETRQAVAEASKTGWVYILDRVTGEPLIGIEERPVPQDERHLTSPTQPYPAGDSFIHQFVDIVAQGFPPLVNQGRIFTPFWMEGVVAMPGPFGGANWPPSAYDPTSGTLFVCANERPGFFRGGEMENDLPEMPGDSYIGGFFGHVPYPNHGILAAMDMHTNTIVWRQRWQQFCYSGVLATAGGLLFTGQSDGRIMALDSSNGAVLWEFQTGAGLNAPVSTFEQNGEQHIIAYSAGNLFAGAPRGDSVWMFSLSGTMDEVSPAGSQVPAPEAEHE